MLETFYDLDELEAAIAGVRSVSSLPIVALMTFDEDAETLARRDRAAGRGTARARSASPPSARTTAPARRRRSRPSSEMQGDGGVLAALPNIGLASMTGSRMTFPHATAGVLQRVRRPGARARRRDDRRLLRDDADRDRRDPRGDRRGPRGDLLGPGARARRTGPGRRPARLRPSSARLLAAGEFVTSRSSSTRRSAATPRRCSTRRARSRRRVSRRSSTSTTTRAPGPG